MVEVVLTGNKENSEMLPEKATPFLHGAWEYWAHISEDGGVPLKANFDPIEVRDIVHQVLLVEVIRNEQSQEIEDFEFRLIGEGIGERMNHRYAHQRLTSIPGKGPDSDIWSAYMQACETRKPVVLRQNYIGP